MTWHGFGEVVTLGQIASHLPQPSQLLGGPHAFRDYPQPEGVAETYCSRDDGRVFGILPESLDEGTINLQVIDGQVFQIVEAGVPCAEVVDRKPYTQISHLLDLADGEFRVVHHDSLRDLEL